VLAEKSHFCSLYKMSTTLRLTQQSAFRTCYLLSRVEGSKAQWQSWFSTTESSSSFGHQWIWWIRTVRWFRWLHRSMNWNLQRPKRHPQKWLTERNSPNEKNTGTAWIVITLHTLDWDCWNFSYLQSTLLNLGPSNSRWNDAPPHNYVTGVMDDIPVLLLCQTM